MNKELIKAKIKEHLFSAVVTFIAAFSFTILGVIQDIDINTEILNSAFWISLLLAGFRAGVKAVAEYLIKLKANRNVKNL